jgi:hypothetical protein
MTRDERLDRFLALSERLTAFTAFELRGTGNLEDYLDTVARIVGEGTLDDMLAAYARAEATRSGDDAALRRELLSDDRLGPIARNVIKLWYLGIWHELPKGWRDAFGAREGDFMFTVSASAYTEALLWPAIGANPSGAKAPGWASWTGPPQIPAESQPPPASNGSTGL